MKRFYNTAVVLLAVVSVGMALADIAGAPLSQAAWFRPVDTAILILFAIDYFVRLYLAKSKMQFVKTNVFDLIAIIPFNAVFGVFRVARIFRIARLARLTKFAKLVRLVGVGGRLKQRALRFLHTNGLIYIIYINLACILLGATAIYYLEQGVTVQTFGDAIWWAFVTATTVGYGDISPSTGAGRVVAGILMIVGIGLISMLTGTIATYFTAENQKSDKLRRVNDLTAALSESDLDALIDQLSSIQDNTKGEPS